MKTNSKREKSPVWPVLACLCVAVLLWAGLRTGYTDAPHRVVLPALAAAAAAGCLAVPKKYRARRNAFWLVYGAAVAVLLLTVIVNRNEIDLYKRWLVLGDGFSFYPTPFAFPAVAAAAGIAADLKWDRKTRTALWLALYAVPLLLTVCLYDVKICLFAAAAGWLAMVYAVRRGCASVRSLALAAVPAVLAACVPLLLRNFTLYAPDTFRLLGRVVLTGGASDPLEYGWDRCLLNELLRLARPLGLCGELSAAGRDRFARIGFSQYGGLAVVLYRRGWAALAGVALCHGLLLLSLWKMTGKAYFSAGGMSAACTALVTLQTVYSYAALLALDAVRITVPLLQGNAPLFVTTFLCFTVIALYLRGSSPFELTWEDGDQW